MTMNISIVDEDDPPPKFLGFCQGIPGQFHGRRMYDSDPDLNMLESGKGVMCDACIDKLFEVKSWGSASPVLHNTNKGRGPGIVINAEKHQALTSKPRMQKGANFRNYPK